jgi:hypothetical protein
MLWNHMLASEVPDFKSGYLEEAGSNDLSLANGDYPRDYSAGTRTAT